MNLRDLHHTSIADKSHMPLVTCWGCQCSVRWVADNGLCPICMPVRRGRSAYQQREEAKGERNTKYFYELNTDSL